MADWGTHIDQQIRKAMEEGQFSNLPGEGKPLNLNEDANTPDDMRIAYKILRENDLAPDWILQSKELDSKTDDLLSKLNRAATRYRAAMSAPGATPASRAQEENAWRTAQTKLTGVAVKLNQEISFYNLKVPKGVVHKPLLNFQREISRLMGSG